MEQADFPLLITQGVSFIQPLYYFDENNNPIDLTGCSVHMQARQTVGADNPAVLDWSDGTGEITIDATAGCVLIAASASVTEDLELMTDGVLIS